MLTIATNKQKKPYTKKMKHERVWISYAVKDSTNVNDVDGTHVNR